jgi:formate dehydrogenase major subunit
MTNGYIDVKNADVILIMGGNPAENHPCGFKWVVEAKRTRNAKVVVIDPRFTRTASQADLFLQIRPGSDIAFLGGLINYAIENGRLNAEYVKNYTNAAFLVGEGFKLPIDGLFSGYNPATHSYDRSSWNYEEGGSVSGKAAADDPPDPKVAKAPAKAPAGMPPNVAYDLTLQHPRCVFQLLKKHYSRYTPEMVERITGIPKADFVRAADLLTSIRKDGDTRKVGTVVYAVGWTQHSYGTQIIRTACIYQLLLGNVGRAGGGVNALRGHSNIQGATDMAGIFDILPGYMKMPIPTDVDLKTYVGRITPKPSKPQGWDSFNYWSNTSKFAVSLLRAFYGDAATKENDFAFHYLPKIDRNYGWVEIWDNMYRGNIKGFMAFGMNGVMIGPDSRKNIEALKKLDWLVVGEIYPDETSEFWNAAHNPVISPDQMKTIQTTVYRLPCAGFAEKDGTFVNSQRWLQWKYIAVEPPGQAKRDQEILSRIFLKVRELYKTEGGKFPDPILHATWNYVDPYHRSFEALAKEVNGRALADVSDPKTKQVIVKAGEQLPLFTALRDDGSTLCGNWLYCGSWTQAGPQSARRGTEDPSGLGIYQEWAWSWPANRRVLYNRASCDLEGRPWDPSRAQVWWDEKHQKWVGNDVPDFKADSPPKDHMGPFIMNNEGVGRIFGPLALFADGPFPEHYEPIESPIANPLHPNVSTSPVVMKLTTPADKYGTPAEGYTIVGTTYRLTEHYHYWTKNNRVNIELVPEPFVEIPAELADQMGIKGGEKVKVTSARASYEAKAYVTRRIKPMTVDGKTVYTVGVPIHWGFMGIPSQEGVTSKTPANVLTPTVFDPNAYTPEFKSFLVKLEKA